jgi:hypothetical protein
LDQQAFIHLLAENSVLWKIFKIHYATWQIFFHCVQYCEQHLPKPFSGSKDAGRKRCIEKYRQDGRKIVMGKKYGKKRNRDKISLQGSIAFPTDDIINEKHAVKKIRASDPKSTHQTALTKQPAPNRTHQTAHTRQHTPNSTHQRARSKQHAPYSTHQTAHTK